MIVQPMIAAPRLALTGRGVSTSSQRAKWYGTLTRGGESSAGGHRVLSRRVAVGRGKATRFAARKLATWPFTFATGALASTILVSCACRGGAPMSTREALMKALESLPEERVREVLRFAEFLRSEEGNAWREFGRSQLARAYGPDEPDYSEANSTRQLRESTPGT